jgi:hypothetical protein
MLPVTTAPDRHVAPGPRTKVPEWFPVMVVVHVTDTDAGVADDDGRKLVSPL